jgi:hypothetical protein
MAQTAPKFSSETEDIRLMLCKTLATVENPLENANVLKRVSFVMKNGFVIKKVE